MLWCFGKQKLAKTTPLRIIVNLSSDGPIFLFILFLSLILKGRVWIFIKEQQVQHKVLLLSERVFWLVFVQSGWRESWVAGIMQNLKYTIIPHACDNNYHCLLQNNLKITVFLCRNMLFYFYSGLSDRVINFIKI